MEPNMNIRTKIIKLYIFKVKLKKMEKFMMVCEVCPNNKN